MTKENLLKAKALFEKRGQKEKLARVMKSLEILEVKEKSSFKPKQEMK